MAQNSSALTGTGNGPSIKELRDWTESLMQQGVEAGTRLTVTTTPTLNQFDVGGWTIKASWEAKP